MERPWKICAEFHWKTMPDCYAGRVKIFVTVPTVGPRSTAARGTLYNPKEDSGRKPNAQRQESFHRPGTLLFGSTVIQNVIS